MPPLPTRKIRVTKLVDITPTVKELFLEAEDGNPIDYVAGQFISFVMTKPDGKKANRAYSIASPVERSDKKGLTLVIKYVVGGLFGETMKQMKGGEVLDFIGPVGKFVLQKPVAPHVIFIGTGTGLAPLYSILKSHAAELKNAKTVKLLFGNWNDKEVFYQDKIEEIKKNIPHFECHHILSQPSDAWKGRTGLVTDDVRAMDVSAGDYQFYLCGNPHMIKDVQAILAEKGLPKTQIYQEAFS